MNRRLVLQPCPTSPTASPSSPAPAAAPAPPSPPSWARPAPPSTSPAAPRARARAPRTCPAPCEDAAAAVSARGGTGIGVVCDHTDPAQVEALVARIGADHGRLDVLVNNAWGGYEQYDGAGFAAPVLGAAAAAPLGRDVRRRRVADHAHQPPRRAAAARGRARGLHDRLGPGRLHRQRVLRRGQGVHRALRLRDGPRPARAPGDRGRDRAGLHAHRARDGRARRAALRPRADRVARVPRPRRRPPRRRPRAPRAHGRAARRPATSRAPTASPTSTARSPRRSRSPRTECARIAGTTTSQSRRASSWPRSLQGEQLGARDLARQRCAVAERERPGPRSPWTTSVGTSSAPRRSRQRSPPSAA